MQTEGNEMSALNEVASETNGELHRSAVLDVATSATSTALSARFDATTSVHAKIGERVRRRCLRFLALG
jgi:hypothetical protein